MKTENQPETHITQLPDAAVVVYISGDWKLGRQVPQATDTENRLSALKEIRRISFEAAGLSGWDSSLLTFLTRIIAYSGRTGITTTLEGLPEGVRRMLELAAAVPEKKGGQKEEKRPSFLARVGESAVGFKRSTGEMLAFIGDAVVALWGLLTGRAKFRLHDLFLAIQESGAQALPIVSLISLLVGIILAFIGAIQLRMFGAQLYVADIVGISMVRVMGAIMTGIIMAGRTGAAFAAQLGTMQTNEEIDALRTFGISPMEFLVLPRMIALTLMMPLLCAYADLVGIMGGFIVGTGMLDITPSQYYSRTVAAVSLTNVWVGLFHSAVFGVLVALSGCLRGMQCGRSASAVGEAATSAVVTSIVCIVVATAIITFSCEMLGI
ncbi:MAG: ABC transporter permease [Thermodesulfovibrionales bacterium]|jgi:phospholipid/cholesterol/gamma-HCH transport system permease protein